MRDLVRVAGLVPCDPSWCFELFALRKTCITECAGQDRTFYTSLECSGKHLLTVGMANEYSYDGQGYVRTGHFDSRMEHRGINNTLD